jgi:hypothetical protein
MPMKFPAHARKNSLLAPAKYPADAKEIPCFAVHKFSAKVLL